MDFNWSLSTRATKGTVAIGSGFSDSTWNIQRDSAEEITRQFHNREPFKKSHLVEAERICLAAERDQGREHAVGRHLENGAATVWAAIGCGPVEIAVAALD